jgi:hypothetical protein
LSSAELCQRERTQKVLRFTQWSAKPSESSLFEEYRLDFDT